MAYPTAGALATAARAALVVQRAPPPVPSPPVVGSNSAAGRASGPATPPPMPQRPWAPVEEPDLLASGWAPSRSRPASVLIIGLVVAVVVGIGFLLTVIRVATPTRPHDPTPTGAATIRVGDRPEGVAGSPDGRRAYITNSRSNTVSVIDIG